MTSRDLERTVSVEECGERNAGEAWYSRYAEYREKNERNVKPETVVEGSS